MTALQQRTLWSSSSPCRSKPRPCYIPSLWLRRAAEHTGNNRIGSRLEDSYRRHVLRFARHIDSAESEQGARLHAVVSKRRTNRYQMSRYLNNLTRNTYSLLQPQRLRLRSLPLGSAHLRPHGIPEAHRFYEDR